MATSTQWEVAHQDSTLITSLKTLTLLSQSEVQRVKTAEEHQALPLIKWPLNWRRVYAARGLLDQAIEVLQSRVQEESQDPQLYQSWVIAIWKQTYRASSIPIRAGQTACSTSF